MDAASSTATPTQDQGTPIVQGNDAIASELRSINQSLENISRKADAWAKKNDIDDSPEAEKETNIQQSRAIAATAMGAIGFKIGGLIGAKLGYLYGVAKNGKNQDAPRGENESFEDSIMKKMHFQEMTVGGIIAGAIGAVGGAILGWVRGGNIKDPKEFFKNPFHAASVLVFGKKEEPAVSSPANEVKSAAISEIQEDASVSTSPTNAWQRKAQASQSEQAAGKGV